MQVFIDTEGVIDLAVGRDLAAIKHLVAQQNAGFYDEQNLFEHLQYLLHLLVFWAQLATDCQKAGTVIGKSATQIAVLQLQQKTVKPACVRRSLEFFRGHECRAQV